MLVLTRKLGEAIVIDGKIKITITQIKAGQVRIGVEAPSDVVVLREELLNEKTSKGGTAGEGK